MSIGLTQGEKHRIEINLAKLKKEGYSFEVVIDPDLAMDFKQGKEVNLHEVIHSPLIFTDAQKGMQASEQLIEKFFDTTNTNVVAEKIIRDGEIQLSGEYRKSMRDKKKKTIINMIHTNAINPQNNLPHPVQRIESAIEEAKIKIDEFKKAEDQVSEVVKKLMTILPIKYEIRILEAIIDAKYAPQSYAILKNFGTIITQDWMNDGSLMAHVKVPAGLQNDFFDKLNSLTHGTVKTKVINDK
jgi:ribosome maturation protein SDO1